MNQVETPPVGRRWGLTGGIGSGKSTVARWLASRGAQVVDADLISRACTQKNGAAMPAILHAFGEGFLAADGSMDRVRMRERIFADPQAKTLLESIVHPCVATSMAQEARESPGALLVFDIPLLVESPHWRTQLDHVLVVDCPRALQVQRVVQRNGLSPSEVEAIIDSQSPRGKRVAAADATLYNDHLCLDDLHLQLEACAHWFGL